MTTSYQEIELPERDGDKVWEILGDHIGKVVQLRRFEYKTETGHVTFRKGDDLLFMQGTIVSLRASKSAFFVYLEGQDEPFEIPPGGLDRVKLLVPEES